MRPRTWRWKLVTVPAMNNNHREQGVATFCGGDRWQGELSDCGNETVQECVRLMVGLWFSVLQIDSLSGASLLRHHFDRLERNCHFGSWFPSVYDKWHNFGVTLLWRLYVVCNGSPYWTILSSLYLTPKS
jgi:hypothetical protein